MLCFENLNNFTVLSDLQVIVDSNCLAFVVLQIHVTESKRVVANKSKDAFKNKQAWLTWVSPVLIQLITCLSTSDWVMLPFIIVVVFLLPKEVCIHRE